MNPGAATVDNLRKALANRNNFIVAKASRSLPTLA
jgi:hypothetical protein